MSVPLPEGYVAIKANSHRARDRLHRLVGDRLVALFFFRPDHSGTVHFQAIPADLVEQARTIPGVAGVRIPKGTEFHRPW